MSRRRAGRIVPDNQRIVFPSRSGFRSGPLCECRRNANLLTFSTEYGQIFRRVYYLCVFPYTESGYAGGDADHRLGRPEVISERRLYSVRDRYDRRDHPRQARAGQGAVVDHRDLAAAGRGIRLLHRVRPQSPQAETVQPQGAARSGADRCAEPATDIRDQSSVAAAQVRDQRSPRYHYAAAQQQQGVADRAQPRPGAERRGGDVRRDTPGAAAGPSRSIWNTTSSRTTSWAARSPTS